MTLDTILTELKAKRDRLNQAIAALEGTTAAGHGRRKAQKTEKLTGRRISAEGRKRLSEAKRKWWAERIPWPELHEARKRYIKWQAFVLWVRAIEDVEGHSPDWLAQLVDKRCSSLQQFVSKQRLDDSTSAPFLWHRLDQWVNERIFAKPRWEGWMDAVGYYAVRDLAALRDEAYWYYCEQQWKNSKPAVYPSSRDWRKSSERCSDEVLDEFETTEEMRELIKLSRHVRPRALNKSVDEYVQWQVFAYWARTALDRGDRLPDSVKREVRRRCAGFLEADVVAHGGNEEGIPVPRFKRLIGWIEEHQFAHARKEGWLPVLVYQARLHPRHARVIDYWRHWEAGRCNHPQSSVVEDPHVEVAEARRVGNHFNLGDLAAHDRKTEHPKQTPARSPHESH